MKRAFALLLSLAALPAGAVEVELLSRVPPHLASETALGVSLPWALSANGRFLVFTSNAQNLVAGVTDGNNGPDIFLFDRATEETVLVSRSAGPVPATANRGSGDVAISADGRFVAFTSAATDLVPGQVAPKRRNDVFLWDRVTGTTELVSHAAGSRVREANGASTSPVLSADGRYVAFASRARDLVSGIANTSVSDVFLYDRRSGQIAPVSRSAVSPGRMANGASTAPAISADGRFIAFVSQAQDLVAAQEDPNGGQQDVFLHDRTTGKTTLVSHAASSPLQAGSWTSREALISTDGRWVAYWSQAQDLIDGQTGGEFVPNIFLWDRETDTTTLVSHAVLALTTGANGDSFLKAISADGSTVIFTSRATNLVHAQQGGVVVNAFAWDRASGRVTLVSGMDGAVTGPGASHDVVSLSASADGRIVAFSTAARLVTGVNDDNGDFGWDVYLHDRNSQTTTLLSRAVDAAEAVGGNFPEVSADGRFIAFTSDSPRLVAGQIDGGATTDLFLHDRISGTTRLVSHVAGSPLEAAGGLGTSDLSADGRFVAFTSDSTRLAAGQVDANGTHDTFLYDRATGEVIVVSRAAGTSATAANRGGAFMDPQLSADGRLVLFLSRSTDLIAGQSGPAAPNLFVFDRTTGKTTLVSRSFASPTRTTALRFALSAVLAANGIAVAFSTDAPDLVPNDFNQFPDAFVASLP